MAQGRATKSEKFSPSRARDGRKKFSSNVFNEHFILLLTFFFKCLTTFLLESVPSQVIEEELLPCLFIYLNFYNCL